MAASAETSVTFVGIASNRVGLIFASAGTLWLCAEINTRRVTGIVRRRQRALRYAYTAARKAVRFLSERYALCVETYPLRQIMPPPDVSF
jgi:hypothetical protein